MKQRGAILIIGLIFLLLLSIIGITALQTDTLQEKMAGNLKDKHTAFQAVEATLRAAEVWLADAPAGALVPIPLNTCQGNCDVLKRPVDGDPIDVWNFDWAKFGRPGPSLSGLAEQPRYFIEEVAVYGSLVRGFEHAGSQPTKLYYYRITGHGVGGTPASETLLQSDYFRP